MKCIKDKENTYFNKLEITIFFFWTAMPRGDSKYRSSIPGTLWSTLLTLHAEMKLMLVFSASVGSTVVFTLLSEETLRPSGSQKQDVTRV